MTTKRTPKPKRKPVTIRVPVRALRGPFKRAAREIETAAEVKPAVVIVDHAGAELVTVPVPPSAFRRLVDYFTK